MSETYEIYSDGGARGNPGPAAIGILICAPDGSILRDYGAVIGRATNNIAEYSAVICGLKTALELGVKSVSYFVDSELVCKQINGEYRVKTPHIRELYLKAVELMRSFEKITFQHVRRTHARIQHVDALVNRALDQAEREGARLADFEEQLKSNPAQASFDF